MKKLLLTLGTAAATVAPLATTIACGTSTNTTFTMNTSIVTGGYSGQLAGIQAGTYDFGGAWADARTTVSGSTEKVVAVGVESFRIANDGIQAKKTMDAHDMAVVQELFVRLIAEAQTNSNLQIGESGEEKSLFDVYSHSDYTKITDSTQEVAYINNDTPVTTKMLQTAPAEDTTNGGDIFEALGASSDWTDFKLKTDQELKINFIPSNNPAEAKLASAALQTFLQTNLSTEVKVDVSTDYNAAALALKNGTIDLAFLPVNTWATHANDTNFILQAGRPLQVATLGWDGTDVSLPGAKITNQAISTLSMNEFSQLYLEDVKTNTTATGDDIDAFEAVILDTDHVLNKFAIAARAKADVITDDSEFIAGSYESFIFGNTDNEITKSILEQYKTGDGNSWTMDGATVLADATYAATSNTSGASFVFPQLWFNRHFETVFKA